MIDYDTYIELIIVQLSIIISRFPVYFKFVIFIVISAQTVVLSSGPTKIKEGGINKAGGNIIKF